MSDKFKKSQTPKGMNRKLINDVYIVNKDKIIIGW